MKVHRTSWVALIAGLSGALQLTAQPAGAVSSSRLEKADKIIGMNVADSRNEHLGKVKELAVDLEGGRVAEILVGVGGLSSSAHLVAVPPECFTLDDNSDELHFTGDVDAFSTAPAFDLSTWMESTRSSSITGVYNRFHVPLHPGTDYVRRAGNIIGCQVRNQRDERLGKIDDFVMELPGGRIPGVIVAETGFLGIKGDLTFVPPPAFLLEPGYNALILDTTRQALRNAPHFKSNEWKDAINDSSGLSSPNNSSSPPVPPAMASDADPLTDETIVAQIEHKILVTDGLSMDARHVEVTARNGRVTLRGTADSEDEKRQLGGIAASVVPADHVDNRIQVTVLAVGKN